MGCFSTSIWDKTFLPSFELYRSHADPQCGGHQAGSTKLCGDRWSSFSNTFFVIAHAERRPHGVQHRYQKSSRKFKLSCSKLVSQFTYIEVHNKNFSTFMDLRIRQLFPAVITLFIKINSAESYGFKKEIMFGFSIQNSQDLYFCATTFLSISTRFSILPHRYFSLLLQ